MAATEKDRWTYHVCPECGSWIRLFGAIKYRMGKCSNKKCSSTEMAILEKFPTRLEWVIDNPAINHGCALCGDKLNILPSGYGSGPDSHKFVGHWLVHNECVKEMEKLLEYQGELFKKEMTK